MRAWMPVVALLVAGCGAEVGAAGPPEDGDRAGAALECAGKPYADGAGDYADSGLESVQDDAEAALADYLEQEGFFLEVPKQGYVVEREDEDRVLLSYDVDGQTKVAFVAADGLTDWKDAEGWGIETWAACDPSELPAQVAADLGVQVWLDDQGDPAPVTTIQSYAGPEHCDWQDITFLTLGSRGDHLRQFFGDPTGKLADWLQTSYAAASGCRPPPRTPASVARGVSSGWPRTARRRTSWCRGRRWPSAGRPRRTRSAATEPVRADQVEQEAPGIGRGRCFLLRSAAGGLVPQRLVTASRPDGGTRPGRGVQGIRHRPVPQTRPVLTPRREFGPAA